MEEYNMIDNGAGALAAVAGYRIVMNKVGEHKGIVGLGCQLIASYIGLQIGGKVRTETRRIRKAVEKQMEKKEPQKPPVQNDWFDAYYPRECREKNCVHMNRFPDQEPCAHCEVCLGREKMKNG